MSNRGFTFPVLKYKNTGFTIVELMVATSIIAVLSVVSLATYSNVQKSQRDYQRKDDLNKVMQALELYRTDMRYYPTNSDFALGIDSKPLVGSSTTYLNPVPDDPKASQDYCYLPLRANGVSGCTNADCASYVVCAKYERSGNSDAPLKCAECACDSTGPGTCNLGFTSK